MERETALPVKRSTLDQVLRVPHDWLPRRVERITKKMRENMRGLGGAFVECAWSEVRGIFNDTDYRDRVDDSPNWLGEQRDSRRQARLLGISVRNSRRFLRCDLPGERKWCEKRGRYVLVPFPLSRWWRQVRYTIWEPIENTVVPDMTKEIECSVECGVVVPTMYPPPAW